MLFDIFALSPAVAIFLALAQKLVMLIPDPSCNATTGSTVMQVTVKMAHLNQDCQHNPL